MGKRVVKKDRSLDYLMTFLLVVFLSPFVSCENSSTQLGNPS